MKPVLQRVPKQPQNNMERIIRFKGINTSTTATQLAYNETPDMLNMVLDSEGRPDKRFGYERIYATSLGAGKINGLFQYRKSNGTLELLKHHTTKFYRHIPGSQPTEIFAGLANNKSKGFSFGSLFYLLDGTNYLQYDGTTMQTVIPYVSTLVISTPPAGGGTALEDFNLIGKAFIQKFSGDGTATNYQLALDNLDATLLDVTVDGTTLVEGTDFTVNRTTGVVTFVTAPSNGTNNVIIQAEKTVAGMADKIRKAVGFKIFGGTNDTRVFVWKEDNILYRTDVNRANYFPENAFQRVGNDATKITGIRTQYDTAVIEKEFSKWGMTYDNSSGTPLFPVRPINDVIGCIAPDSLQLIDNSPVSLSKKGVYGLTGGVVRDERNVTHLSYNVDKNNEFVTGLLSEANLENAISIDFDKKYFLALNGRVFIMDYDKRSPENPVGEWLIWNNIPASCFLEYEGRLYFGDSENGLVYEFKKRGDSGAHNDDGAIIEGYWKSRVTNFGLDERLKTVPKVFFSIKPDTVTSADLYYINENGGSSLVNTVNMSLYSYTYFDYARFTYVTSNLPQVTRTKVKAKKIIYFQLMIKNDKLNESLGILSVNIENRIGGYVK
jgi:hypothetical protein